MMERVGVRELKDRLAYYLRTVRQGETVVVTIRGKPVARLVPISGCKDKALTPEILFIRRCEEKLPDKSICDVLALDNDG